MLKKWIDEIRNQPELYKSECWKYHLSGNAVEISILPAYLKKKMLYRCSVIAVGQVLQALAKKIEGKHLNFHIQSFPNLENPAIVATIRTDQKGNFTNQNGFLRPHSIEQKDFYTSLRNLSEHYQFTLKKVESPLDIELEAEISFENYKNWFVIYSTHNNPFTWLNVGYLKESIKNLNSVSSANVCKVFDLCLLSIEQQSKSKISENEYLQSLVGIQSVNIKAE